MNSNAKLRGRSRPVRNALAYQAALIILVVGTFVGVLIGGIGVQLLSVKEKDRLAVQLEQLADTVERTANIAAFVGDKNLASEVAEGLLRNELVSRVVIRGGEEILADSHRAGETPEQDVRSLKRPLTAPFDPQRTVGELELVPSAGYLHRKVAEFSAAVRSMLAAVIGAVVVVVVGVVLYRVAVPIKDVSDQLHALEDNGRSGRLRVPAGHQGDEIGVLVTDINSLISRIVAREKLYGAIVSQAADIILVVDGQSGRFVEANDAARTQLGYTSDELFALDAAGVIPEFGSLPGVDSGPGQELTTVFETHCRRKSGEPFDARVSSGVISTGSRTLLVWLVSDITPQKRAAEQLRRNRDELQQRVDEQTHDLIIARDKAEHLARVKSEFLANMSHEIRTPLNAVLGLARIGARDSAGRVNQETFGRILDAGEHLLGVINDILDMSKIEAGKMSVESRPFELGTIISRAARFIASQAEAKGLACATEQAADLPESVVGDGHRLQQVLVNLLSNAVKFTERGEVRLQVRRSGEFIEFAVIDSGMGMTREQTEKVFSPFEQADTSTSRRFGGTGLGLPISLHLAELMGGSIVVDSTPGIGSRFTLRLPLRETDDSTPAPSMRPAPVESRLEGLRVLAAEDIEVNRFVLEDLITHEGAQIALAENGQLAIERLSQSGAEAFDVVLMDIQMPEMDGYAATRRILEIAPKLPVIGLTAHALAEERDRCLAAGMREHITKPIDAEELVSAILRVCRPEAFAAGVPRPVEPWHKHHQDEAIPHRPLIDWCGFLAHMGGRQSSVDRIVQSALQSLGDRVAQLREAVRNRDHEALALHAHAVKGITGHLKADAVMAAAGRCESAAKSKDEGVCTRAGELIGFLDELLVELAARRKPDSPATGPTAQETAA